MLYPSKKDLFAKLLPALGIVVLAADSLLLWAIVGADAPPVFLLLFLLALIVGILFLWIPSSTSCEITDTAFIARSGPFWRKIPLKAITEVVPRRGVLYGSWGFALSLNALLIKYRKKNGKPALLPVAVSPEDKAGFLAELAKGQPGLTNGGDGKSHAYSNP